MSHTAAPQPRLRLVQPVTDEPMSHEEALASAKASWEQVFESFHKGIASIAALHEMLSIRPVRIGVEIPQALHEARALLVAAEQMTARLEEIHTARETLISAGGQ